MRFWIISPRVGVHCVNDAETGNVLYFETGADAREVADAMNELQEARDIQVSALEARIDELSKELGETIAAAEELERELAVMEDDRNFWENEAANWEDEYHMCIDELENN